MMAWFMNKFVYVGVGVYVRVYWTRLVLDRPAASPYSASPLKHHATGRQGYPNPDHYPDSEPASQSLTLISLLCAER